MRRKNLSMLIVFLFIGNVSISYAQEGNNEKDKFFVYIFRSIPVHFPAAY